MNQIKTFIEKDLFLGSQAELLQMIVKNSNDKNKMAYYAINADCMLHYWKDKDYRRIIDLPDNLVYVDGMGVIYAQKFLNIPCAKERIATTDLFPALMDNLNKKKSSLRIFLLGGKRDTADRVKEKFANIYPTVQIVGTHDGYFDKNEDSTHIINLINSLQIDILFVGFGNPLQEKWVDQHFHLFKISSLITCGGLFDYYAENVKRAPLVIQKIGFEWLYRLMQEPKRLYKRYLFGNLKYIVKVFTLKFAK